MILYGKRSHRLGRQAQINEKLKRKGRIVYQLDTTTTHLGQLVYLRYKLMMRVQRNDNISKNYDKYNYPQDAHKS